MDAHDCLSHTGDIARRQTRTVRSLIAMLVGVLGLALGLGFVTPAVGGAQTDLPDLAPTALEAPSVLARGEEFTVRLTVANHGTAISSDAFWSDSIAFSSDATFEEGTDRVSRTSLKRGPVVAGGSYEVEMTGFVSDTLAPGSYYLLVVVDRFGELTESNEANNLRAVQVMVTTPPTAAAGGPYTVAEGSSLTLDGSGSSDPDAGDTLTYAWDTAYDGVTFEPDPALTGPSPTVTYDDSGTAIVALRVTDTHGAESDIATATVTVANVAPTVTAADAQTATEGQARDFALGSFSDPGADTWGVVVDWGDGTPAESFVPTDSGSLPMRAHTYQFPGTFQVTVTVTDQDAGSGGATFAVTVANVAPQLTVDQAEVRVAEGGQATASGAFAGPTADLHRLDATSGVVTNNGDGTWSWRATPADGPMETMVTVTATDHSGATGEASFRLVVNNVAPTLSVADAQIAWAGMPQPFSLGSFTDPGADAWGVVVNWGDGTPAESFGVPSTGTLPTRPHTYAMPGTYQVTVTVTDEDAGRGEGTFAVTVNDPTPTLTVDQATVRVAEGGQAANTGAVRSPIGDPVSLAASSGVVTNHGDGTWRWYATPSDGPMETTVTITAADSAGREGAVSFTLVVANVAPTVEAGPAATIQEGEALSRPGHLIDPGTDQWTATVDYGDGSGVQPLEVTGTRFDLRHRYADDGTYTATVRVDDGDGGIGTATVQVTVANVAPALTVTGSGTAAEGGAYALGLAATDPGADTITAWHIDWGDGSAPERLDGAAAGAAHVYADNGLYTVAVAAVDEDGTYPAAPHPVTVANVAPAVDAGDDTTIAEGGTFTSAATSDDAGARDTHTATVTYGDGSPTETVTPGADGTIPLQHPYAQNGTYIVSIEVTDDDGAVGADSLTVTVTNAAPTVEAGEDVALTEGETSGGGTATYSDPGVLDTHTATVDYGDGTVVDLGPVSDGAVAIPAHPYPQSGTYTVTVAVTDSDGAVGTDQLTVTVANAPPVVGALSGLPAHPIGFPVPVEVRADFTDLGVLDGHTATIAWGDGTVDTVGFAPGNGAGTVTGSHAYATGGLYTVTVTVTDTDGGVGSTSGTVDVRGPVDPPPGQQQNEPPMEGQALPQEEAPPTEAPPTEMPSTEAPPTEPPPTEAPPTEEPPAEG